MFFSNLNYIQKKNEGVFFNFLNESLQFLKGDVNVQLEKVCFLAVVVGVWGDKIITPNLR